jgi:hypothetical protein
MIKFVRLCHFQFELEFEERRFQERRMEQVVTRLRL